MLYGGHSMVSALRRVLVCAPHVAGWNDPTRQTAWRELGFNSLPSGPSATDQHEQLCHVLCQADTETIQLDAGAGLTLDAVYAHDASFVTDQGVLLLRAGKTNRRHEAQVHAECFGRLQIPIAGRIEPPGTLEAGDLVWLDSHTVLAGRGYRSNASGINQLKTHLDAMGVELIQAPLPHGSGPEACLHLMSLLSMLDEQTALVDREWLSVETLEALVERGFRLLDIEPKERSTLACNVLALGGRRLLALVENKDTNQRLTQAGFDVRTMQGSELCINGSGGPTCLTRPLLRS